MKNKIMILAIFFTSFSLGNAEAVKNNLIIRYGYTCEYLMYSASNGTINTKVKSNINGDNYDAWIETADKSCEKWNFTEKQILPPVSSYVQSPAPVVLEKIVYVDKPIEKIVYVEKIVYITSTPTLATFSLNEIIKEVQKRLKTKQYLIIRKTYAKLY
jgi:hypothetical protein